MLPKRIFVIDYAGEKNIVKSGDLDFQNFIQLSKKNNIKVIAGIAPGLDFNFKELHNISINNENSDFELLFKKAKQLLEDGASSIALMLDDIPNDFKKNLALIYLKVHIMVF